MKKNNFILNQNKTKHKLLILNNFFKKQKKDDDEMHF